METNCTTANYNQIYAPWLSNAGQLLDLSGWQPGMTLLDLCGGTGAVSQEALRRGADPTSITLLDLQPRAGDLGVRSVAKPVEELGPFGDLGDRFDRIILRQAVAYIRPDRLHSTFRGIHRHLAPGGRFSFNAFTRPKIFARVRNGHFEAGAYFGRTVWHLQTAGPLWDVSRFHWFTEAEFDQAIWLAGFQLLTADHDDRSLRYVCHR